MYTLSSSLVLNHHGWVESNVGNQTFDSLYQNFEKIYLNLVETIHNVEVNLDLNEASFRKKQRYSKQTVNEFLVDNGDLYLPVEDEHRSLSNINRVHYFDRALEPELTKADPTVMGYEYSTKRPLVKAPDLLLANLPDAYNSCIATCAGLAHIIKPVPQGSCIELGHETMMAFEDNSYGLHDFKELGTLRQFPLREELISESDNGLIISLEEDITDKLVLLVINGSIFYSHGNQPTFSKNSPRTIFLDSGKVAWKSLILSTQRELDLDHLELMRVPNGDSSLSVSELADKELHKKMLLGPRSFAVVVTPHEIDKPITAGVDVLFDAGLAVGVYMAGEMAPAGILLNERNQPVNYINQLQDDIYLTKTNQFKALSYAHETAPWQLGLNIDDSRLMSRKIGDPSLMRNLSFYQVK